MTRHYMHTGEAAARAAIALLPGLKEKRTMPTPEERRKRLLAKVRRMPAARVKRAVLRFLVGVKMAGGR